MNDMIRIVHLYSDIMNLYGEYGNVRILKDRLDKCGLETEIVAHRYGDAVNLEDASFIYAGAGTENKFFRVLEDVLKYKSELESYISDGGLGLFTGTACDLTAKEIKVKDGGVFTGLGIFEDVCEIDKSVRFTGDVICSSALFPQSVVGFINKSSNTTIAGEPLFKVDHQFMNLFIPDVDGSYKNGFLATHLIGPILVKNPPMLEYFVKKLCEANGAEYAETESDEAMKAYETGLANLLGARNF